MGRGSGTAQRDVKKPRARHVEGDGSGVSSFGGGISGGEALSNACLFSLELRIKYIINDSPRVARGDTVTLARLNAEEIGVFINNRRLSLYTGSHKHRLLDCMARGYVYSGQVQSLGANSLRVIVKGGTLSHETTSAA